MTTRLEDKITRLQIALTSVRQELWVDYCLSVGRTDIDPREFNARPHIRMIDAAIVESNTP